RRQRRSERAAHSLRSRTCPDLAQRKPALHRRKDADGIEREKGLPRQSGGRTAQSLSQRSDERSTSTDKKRGAEAPLFSLASEPACRRASWPRGARFMRAALPSPC